MGKFKPKKTEHAENPLKSRQKAESKRRIYKSVQNESSNCCPNVVLNE